MALGCPPVATRGSRGGCEVTFQDDAFYADPWRLEDRETYCGSFSGGSHPFILCRKFTYRRVHLDLMDPEDGITVPVLGC